MNDLEQIMRNRLREISDEATIPQSLWDETESRITATQSKQHWMRWGGAALAIAAVVVVAIATFAALHSAPGKHVETQAPPSFVPPGTVMLAARGRDVVALDANGAASGPLYTAPPNRKVVRAEMAPDGKSLWYLTISSRPKASLCGDLSRMDVATKQSVVITKASDFALSPDGSTLALVRMKADVPTTSAKNTDCVRGQQGYALWTRDIATGKEAHFVVSNLNDIPITTLAHVGQPVWAPDGSRFLSPFCTGRGCFIISVDSQVQAGGYLDAESLETAPTSPMGQNAIIDQGVAAITWGDALYVVRGDHLQTYVDGLQTGIDKFTVNTSENSATKGATVFETRDFFVTAVLYTNDSIYVVAQRLDTQIKGGLDGKPRLYRLDSGKLVAVGDASDPGALSAIPALAPLAPSASLPGTTTTPPTLVPGSLPIDVSPISGNGRTVIKLRPTVVTTASK
jgi:hypothetical protein